MTKSTKLSVTQKVINFITNNEHKREEAARAAREARAAEAEETAREEAKVAAAKVAREAREAAKVEAAKVEAEEVLAEKVLAEKELSPLTQEIVNKLIHKAEAEEEAEKKEEEKAEEEAKEVLAAKKEEIENRLAIGTEEIKTLEVGLEENIVYLKKLKTTLKRLQNESTSGNYKAPPLS